MLENTPQLKLSNQICFPLYSVSRLIIQQYKPLLKELEITYPQYLVLLVLWEKDSIPIKEIAEKLFLETNTLTPLLKRMEANKLINRNRSKDDERVVLISLAKKGKEAHQKAIDIPAQLIEQLDCFAINGEDAQQLKTILDKILVHAQ